MEGRPPRAYHRYRSNAQRKRQLRRRRFGALTLAAAVLVVAVVTVVMTSAGGDPRVPSASAASPSVSTLSPPATASPSPSPRRLGRLPGRRLCLPGAGRRLPLRLRLKKTLSGGLTAKSVVATDTGLVSAQNMIYMHTVSYFNSKTLRLVKTVSDAVRLSAYGYPQYSSPVRGGPVEAAVSADRRYEYISNYSMYGPGFSRPGDDVGGPGQYDRSFVYRINLRTLKIDQAIRVGAVPKFLATTPDGKYLLVSNWTSYSLSVVDVARHRQVREITLGRIRVVSPSILSRVTLTWPSWAPISQGGSALFQGRVAARRLWPTPPLHGPEGPGSSDINASRWLRSTRAAGAWSPCEHRAAASQHGDRSDGKSLYLVNYVSTRSARSAPPT